MACTPGRLIVCSRAANSSDILPVRKAVQGLQKHTYPAVRMASVIGEDGDRDITCSRLAYTSVLDCRAHALTLVQCQCLRTHRPHC